MTHYLRYFDTNNTHCHIWEQINNEFEMKTERDINKIFSNTRNNILANALQKNRDKYLYVLHIGEQFFRINGGEFDIEKINLWCQTWKKHLRVYSDRIVIIFVSGDTVPIVENNVPTGEWEKSHFVVDYIKNDDRKQMIREAIVRWKRGEPFKLLDNPHPLIHALSILCQTYLIIKGNDEDKEAIGWNKYADKITFSDKTKNMNFDKNWWTKPFNGEDDFLNKIKEECGCGNDECSIEKIFENNGRNITPKIITDAYDQIKSIIGKK